MPWSSGSVLQISVPMAESSEMWVPILAATAVLVSFSKTLNCSSPPRSKWVPGEGRVGLLRLISPICAEMAAIELKTPQGAEMVSGKIYEPDEQG